MDRNMWTRAGEPEKVKRRADSEGRDRGSKIQRGGQGRHIERGDRDRDRETEIKTTESKTKTEP